MKIDKDFKISERIVSIIESCNTIEQLDGCKNIINFYDNQYNNSPMTIYLFDVLSLQKLIVKKKYKKYA